MTSIPPASDATAADSAGGAMSGVARRRVGVIVALVLGAIAPTQLYERWAYHTTVPIRDLANAEFDVVPIAGVLLLALYLLFWRNARLNGWVARGLDRIRRPRPTARRIATAAIALASAAYFYGTAVELHRSLVPLWHDSNQHLVQAQLLLHGRLWATPHPLADQMETFFVMVKPVYAAIHFPGTSMLYAPLLALGVSPAVFSSLMSGAIVGLTYRVVCELIDGVAAALTVPFLLGLTVLREISVMLLSHHVFLVPTLLAFWAFLRWARRPGGHLGFAAVIGCLCGYAGIMRPVEALAYAIAIGVGMLAMLRGGGVRRTLATGLVVCAAASPWIALQAVFNYNVTGHVLRPPYEEYVQRFHPQTSYGSYGKPGDPVPAIETNLPQKVDYYRGFIRRALTRYQTVGPIATLLADRLPMTLAAVAPFPMALAFALPLAFCWPRSRRRRRAVPRLVLPLAAVLFGAFYVPHVFYLPHYPVAIVPVAAFLVALGVHVSGRAFAGASRSAEAFFAVVLLACCLANFPQVDRYVRDDTMLGFGVGNFVNGPLPTLVKKPAILLCYYRRWDQPADETSDGAFDEPVYTIDALWPEDSPIARFQDLGPKRNREIYQFFADRQPQRTVYLLDRPDHQLVLLGNVRDLLANGEPADYFKYTHTTAPPAGDAASAKPTTRP